LVELLVVLGLITVLMGLGLAGASKLRKRAQSVSCISNLRQIGEAFTQYVNLNNRFFPPPRNTNTGPSWELTLSGSFINDSQIFRCPADDVVYPFIGSSYDWRDTGDPATTVAGTAITDETRGNFVLALEAMSNFHAKGKTNVVFMDGSAGEMDAVACYSDMIQPIRMATISGSGPILSGN
jgi:prepilin-type processing-associated H-X9-DG protein